MDIFFGDSSKQANPERPGMGPLVSTGGIYVPGDRVNSLERRINEICVGAGFPPGEEFKWSPRRTQWMYANLVGAAREQFFLDVLRACAEHEGQIAIMINDASYSTATGCGDHEEDVTCLLIERVHSLAQRRNENALIIVDRPAGGRAEEEAFLAGCFDTIQSGTRYVRPQQIALNALSTTSHFVRLLQVADLVTGCSTAFVAGERRFTPPVFDAIRPMMPSNLGRIGGVGLKIHPNYRYVNLYHWLLGDGTFWKMNLGCPLPIRGRPYARSATDP